VKPDEDKATCLAIAEKIDRDVQVARTHRYWNTVLSGMAVLMLVNNWWLGIRIGRQVNNDYLLSKETSGVVATVKARQDLYRQQYLNYIKDTIDFMQKLQEKNPDIDVPKAPLPRALISSKDDVTEEDLKRVIQTKPGPSPTPIVKKETKKIYIKVKPKPTPKSYKWPWEHPKSTR